MIREFETGAVVSQKRYSRKMSWVQHDDKAKLDQETKRAIDCGNSDYGYDVKRWRFRYRVNLYIKGPLTDLSGPMGRI